MNQYNDFPSDDTALINPLMKTGRWYFPTIALLSAIVAWGIYCWFYQIRNGLGVTGMNRPIFWGIYIANFVFFIGISHAGTLISAILRVTDAGWRKPVTRCAEAITVFALMVGPINVIIDLGRVDRMLNILPFIKYGRFQSPLLWDVVCITIYLLSSVTFLYLPLIPDCAMLRDKYTKRRWFYRILALGWTGLPWQKKLLETLMSIMTILIIPIAVSVHTVVSWVFAMTIQPMWHSTIFGPYFVVGAIFSGIASLIIAMAILRKVFHLEEYLKPIHFNNLGLLLLTMCLLWFYFTFAEYITVFYGAEPEHMAVFYSKLGGEFTFTFVLMVLLCLVIPFIFLAPKKLRTITGTVIASIAINIGMWLERFLIVVPTLSRPRLDYGHGIYHPTWVEFSIFAGEVATLCLLYCLFVKLFPIISIWELREKHEEEKAPAKETVDVLSN
ncbi:MAG: polysulfide reductase NrfD [Deltaproteobacteria bacterium]|nr:polysulfide reductase NrfD [Deltaproteobacteria bacterium]